MHSHRSGLRLPPRHRTLALTLTLTLTPTLTRTLTLTPSKAEYLRRFAIPPRDPRYGREGLHRSWSFGPPGRTLQLVLMDTRWSRSPYLPTDCLYCPGKVALRNPNPNPSPSPSPNPSLSLTLAYPSP